MCRDLVKFQMFGITIAASSFTKFSFLFAAVLYITLFESFFCHSSKISQNVDHATDFRAITVIRNNEITDILIKLRHVQSTIPYICACSPYFSSDLKYQKREHAMNALLDVDIWLRSKLV